jgi:hypothetical protein
MYFHRKPDRFDPKFEIVACWLMRPDGRFVLLHRQPWKPEGNTWGVPAGKIEEGEVPIVATALSTASWMSAEAGTESGVSTAGVTGAAGVAGAKASTTGATGASAAAGGAGAVVSTSRAAGAGVSTAGAAGAGAVAGAWVAAAGAVSAAAGAGASWAWSA